MKKILNAIVIIYLTSGYNIFAQDMRSAIEIIREIQLIKRQNPREVIEIKKAVELEFIPFIKKEKNFQSMEETKKWIRDNPKEASAIKYYLIGLKQTDQERIMICDSLLKDLMPIIKKNLEEQDKIVSGELLLPINSNISIEQYKQLVNEAERDVAEFKTPREWYWLVRDNVQKKHSREAIYFKDFAECPHILRKSTRQLVQEYSQ